MSMEGSLDIPRNVFTAIYMDSYGEEIGSNTYHGYPLSAAEGLAIEDKTMIEYDAGIRCNHINLYSLQYCSAVSNFKDEEE